MACEAKYFIFNKKCDFERGFSEQISFNNTGITITDSKAVRGVFFSRLLDGREKQLEWHRLIVDRRSYGESSIYFNFYVSEERIIPCDDRRMDIEDIIESNDISTLKKEEVFAPYMSQSFRDPYDALLHNTCGRYLWFQVYLTAQGEFKPEIYKIKIIFPKNTWAFYLPEVYEENAKSASFVERYLGIFQSIYEDMTKEINEVAKYFDPCSVKEEHLRWLADWLRIDNKYVWEESKLRYLVVNAVKLYAIRGTIEYLETFVWLYTGQKPYVVENVKLDVYKNNVIQKQLLEELYGESNYLITVIIKPSLVDINDGYKILTKIIDSSVPAHIETNLVLLKPYIFLDGYTYMGINSVLNRYKELELNDQSELPFITI